MKAPLLAAALAASFGSAIAQDMIAVSWSGSTYRLDSATGVGTVLAASGFSQLNSMAASGGAIYTATGGNLVAIDPSTGAGSVAVTLSPALNSVRGLATDAAGLVYAIEDGGTVTLEDKLYRIDVATGIATFVGNTTGYSGVQGLAFSPAGTLFGYETGSGTGIGAGLVVIDPATGAVTDVNPALSGSANDIQCLAFSAAGVLHGARSSLYSIDTATGALTLVGSGGYSDLRGIEFCVGPASTAVRLGTPANPNALRPFLSRGPIIGGIWDPYVDHTTFLPGAILDGYVLSLAPANVALPPYGTVLCDSTIAASLLALPPAPLVVGLPNDCRFVGVRLCVQALAADAALNVRLTNAVDVVIGSF
ncbi:MAG: hypothetical protein KDE27_25470 [Planctomycetes bacterium]|nr:hypothetical protein [Planctomycetota bacterium]